MNPRDPWWARYDLGRQCGSPAFDGTFDRVGTLGRPPRRIGIAALGQQARGPTPAAMRAEIKTLLRRQLGQLQSQQ